MKKTEVLLVQGQRIVYGFFSVIFFAFSFFFLSSCKDDVTTPSTTSGIQYPFYSEDYSLPQTQGPQQLSDYLTGPHTDYHQYGWNICASLVDSTNATLAFFIAIEYNASEKEPYRGGVGFGKTEEDGYKWSGFTNTSVQTTSNPWSVTLTTPLFPGSFITIQLASGLMGSSNAVYKLTADVYDFNGKNLKVDVRLRDQFGAMNQGYGTTSFYPHYLTSVQRNSIMALPEKTIGAYLTASGDRMSFQGAYYYALPLMDVEQFNIEYDGSAIHGSSGKSWMDYFVKSYNEESLVMQKGAKWNWIAIQLPEINSAINVLDISSTVSGPLPYARLFNMNSERTKNGARKAVHSWGVDEITVEPFGEEWVTSTGQKYSMQYRVRLQSSTMPGDFTVTMLRKNQAVVLPEGSNYQGLGIVDGVLGGKAVHGQCWVEVQPVGL